MTNSIRTILSAILVAILIVICVPCTMKVSAETTSEVFGRNSKVYAHSFTDSGLVSDFFTIEGNTTDSKGTVVYNGMELSICLKMQTSPKTSIKFTTKTDGATLTIVAKASSSNATIKLDGSKWGDTITNELVVITKKLGNASTYEITKGSGESLIYFIMVEEAGEESTSQSTTEAPTTKPPTTEAPTTEAPTTKPPTTEAPTTEAPTTEGPTTKPPTTEAPTTEAPTTEAPTEESTIPEDVTTPDEDEDNPEEEWEDEVIDATQGPGNGNSGNNSSATSSNTMKKSEKGTGFDDVFTAIIILFILIAIIALIVFDSPLKKFLGGIINGKSNSNY